LQLDLFLVLTALLCALTGSNRAAEVRAPAVEASRVVGVVQAVAPAARRLIALRPDGYVAPPVLRLDPDSAPVSALRPAFERRRE
jgi:hypothetical protein